MDTRSGRDTHRAPPLIAAIRSGGQSGVDRGALDAARAEGVCIEGYCPAGGWAEDFPDAPGLLVVYPELTETPSPDPAQRTEWNVRDSHVTLVIAAGAISQGTTLTVDLASAYGRPVMTVARPEVNEVLRWLCSQGRGLTVNVAGPRASEWPDAYRTSKRLVGNLLRLNVDR